MLEPPLKPVKANEDDEGVDRNRIGKHGDAVEHDLLIRLDFVNINGVEAALSGRAAGEEDGVDVS